MMMTTKTMVRLAMAADSGASSLLLLLLLLFSDYFVFVSCFCGICFQTTTKMMMTTKRVSAYSILVMDGILEAVSDTLTFGQNFRR